MKQTSITLTEETPFNVLLQYHPYQKITLLARVQIITMPRTIGDCAFFHLLCLMLFSTYSAQNYAGIIGVDLLFVVRMHAL